LRNTAAARAWGQPRPAQPLPGGAGQGSGEPSRRAGGTTRPTWPWILWARRSSSRGPGDC